MDCLALVGQPTPQYPRFQQPRTLRGITFQSKPSFAAPSFSTALFLFGLTCQGSTPKRSSILANQGAISSLLMPFTPNSFAQCSSVCSGVRKLEVQLITVVPPTQRPCKIDIEPSLLIRPALSWYISR